MGAASRIVLPPNFSWNFGVPNQLILFPRQNQCFACLLAQCLKPIRNMPCACHGQPGFSFSTSNYPKAHFGVCFSFIPCVWTLQYKYTQGSLHKEKNTRSSRQASLYRSAIFNIVSHTHWCAMEDLQVCHGGLETSSEIH